MYNNFSNKFKIFSKNKNEQKKSKFRLINFI